MSAHCALAIEAVAEHCVAVKPQVACFERLGAPGWSALREVVELGREHGLLVIADAKRGDIDVTAAAYAQAFFGETPTPFGAVPGLGADALTVNPLLGSDSLEPFLSAARPRGGGLFVLVRTSNPGARDAAGAGAGGRRDRERAAGRDGGAAGGGRRSERPGCPTWAPWSARPRRTGWRALRERMPHAIFLLPGVGAQGGRVEDLAAAFAPGPGGGLVSASRGIVDAYAQRGGSPAAAAASEAARLRELAWELAG